MASGLVTWAVMVEAGLLAAISLLLIGRAGWRDLRAGHRAAADARIREILTRAAGDQAPGEQERVVLSRCSFGRIVALLAELAPSLEGRGRDRLGAVAAEAGVLAAVDRRCASRFWWRRLQGARVLTLLGVVTPARAVLLDDPHPEVRAEAARGAGDHAAPETIDRLLAMSVDPAPLVRFAAKNSLMHLGRGVVATLAEHLDRAPPDSVDAALEVAAALAEPRLLRPALAHRGDRRAGTRARVVDVAAAVGGQDAVEALHEMLADPAAEVRAAAARGLGRLGHWPAGPRLAAALRDPAWDVRRSAGLALREIGAPGALLLRRALADGDRFAHDMARQVLDLDRSP